MPEDLEVGVKLVPDEQALEDVEDREVQGSLGGVGDDESVELDEERNQKLQQVNRGVGRIASKLGFLAVIAAAIAGLAKLIGEIFDISFDDIRQGIVEVINDLASSFANFIADIPTGLAGDVFGEQTTNRVQGASVGGIFGFPGMLAGAILGDQGGGTQTTSTSNQNNGINIFTSRDSLLGDSTQKEMESSNVENFIINGGS